MLNAAIQCSCNAVLVYDCWRDCACVECPSCGKLWRQQPPMFDDVGRCARPFPQVLDCARGKVLNDHVATQVAKAVREKVEGADVIFYCWDAGAPTILDAHTLTVLTGG